MELNIIPFTVSFEDPEKDIKNLIRIVKPEWKNEELETKKLSGGFSCIMYKCGPKSDNFNGDAVTIRARGKTLQDFPHVLHNRDFEVAALKAVSQKGLFPKMQAVFQNGYCYEFVKGKQVVNLHEGANEVKSEQLREIAAKLAEIHCTKVEFEDPTFTSGTKVFDYIEMLLTDHYTKLTNPLKNVQWLLERVRDIKSRVLKLGLPKVLVHGDPHVGNVIQDEEAFGFQNPENWEREYVAAYLKKWNEIHEDKSEVTEEKIEEFLRPVKLYEMLFCLFISAVFECQTSLMEELDRAKTNADPSGTFDAFQLPQRLYADYDALSAEILA